MLLPEEARKLAKAGIAGATVAGRIYTTMTAGTSHIVPVIVQELVDRLEASERAVQYGLRRLKKEGLIERIPPESYEIWGILETYAGTVYLLPLRDPKRATPSGAVIVEAPMDAAAFVSLRPDATFEDYLRTIPRRRRRFI